MRWKRWSQTCRVAPQCSQESPLDIEHQAAENRILGPGGTQGNLSLLGHTLPLILPGQPLVLDFFRPVVCEPVMLSSALRRMESERALSVTTRETVSAPIRVNAATVARLLTSSGVPSSNPPARASTSFKNPAVAAARVCVSARAISLPSAASGQPSRGLSRCSVERYSATAASRPFRPRSREALEATLSVIVAIAAEQASATS